jgi:hypothetical protein
MKDAWMKVEFMTIIVTIDQSSAGVNSVGTTGQGNLKVNSIEGLFVLNFEFRSLVFVWYLFFGA